MDEPSWCFTWKRSGAENLVNKRSNKRWVTVNKPTNVNHRDRTDGQMDRWTTIWTGCWAWQWAGVTVWSDRMGALIQNLTVNLWWCKTKWIHRERLQFTHWAQTLFGGNETAAPDITCYRDPSWFWSLWGQLGQSSEQQLNTDSIKATFLWLLPSVTSSLIHGIQSVSLR